MTSANHPRLLPPPTSSSSLSPDLSLSSESIAYLTSCLQSTHPCQTVTKEFIAVANHILNPSLALTLNALTIQELHLRATHITMGLKQSIDVYTPSRGIYPVTISNSFPGSGKRASTPLNPYLISSSSCRGQVRVSGQARRHVQNPNSRRSRTLTIKASQSDSNLYAIKRQDLTLEVAHIFPLAHGQVQAEQMNILALLEMFAGAEVAAKVKDYLGISDGGLNSNGSSLRDSSSLATHSEVVDDDVRQVLLCQPVSTFPPPLPLLLPVLLPPIPA